MFINVIKFHNSALSLWSSTFLRTSITFILIIATSHATAKLTWTIVDTSNLFSTNPYSKQQQLNSNVLLPTPETILSGALQLFGSAKTLNSSLSFSRQEDTSTTISKLNMVLKGVISFSNSEKSLAVISNIEKNYEDEVYGIGDGISEQASIAKIYKDRVIISRLGRQESLPLMDWAQTTSSNHGNSSQAGVSFDSKKKHRTIDKTFFNKQLDNIPALAKDVSLSVSKRGKIQEGYKLHFSKVNSLLNRLGLKSGDILLEVNGIKLSDAGRGIATYKSLRNTSLIRLVIRRNGAQQSLAYSIK